MNTFVIVGIVLGGFNNENTENIRGIIITLFITNFSNGIASYIIFKSKDYLTMDKKNFKYQLENYFMLKLKLLNIKFIIPIGI